MLVVLACLGLTVFFLRYLASGRALLAVRIGVVVFEIAGVGGLFYLFSTHRTDGWAGLLTLPIILFLVGQLIVLALVVLVVLLRFLWRSTCGVPYSAERRRVLKNAALYPAAGFLLSSYGAFVERKSMVRRDYVIPVRNLPPEADGMVIAQISDVHLGMFFSLERLKSLLQQVADAAPDALLLTGDIFDYPEWTAEAVHLIDGFATAFPDGIWYCHGNHEHIRGIALVEEALATSKIHFLKNEYFQKIHENQVKMLGFPYDSSITYCVCIQIMVLKNLKFHIFQIIFLLKNLLFVDILLNSQLHQ